MKLIELFSLTQQQRNCLEKNYTIMERAVEKIGKKYEQKSYEELLYCSEESVLKLAENQTITCYAEAYHVQKNGTICFCIDADGLPTIFGIKPSYHFYKRINGSVYW